MPTPALASVFTAALDGLPTVFDSDFFVTGAFDCTVTDFAVALDKGLVADGAAALAADFVVALFSDFSVATFGVAAFALPCLAALGFFAAAAAADLAEEDLAAAGLALFAGSVRGFAGFFIAFAMESTTNWLCSCRAVKLRSESRFVRHSRIASAQYSLMFCSFGET